MPEAFDYSPVIQNRILKVLAKDPSLCGSVEGYLKPDMFDGRVRQWAAHALFEHVRKHGVCPDKEAMGVRLRRDLKVKRLLPEYAGAAEILIERMQKPAKDRTFVRDEIWKFAQNQMLVDAVKKQADAIYKHDYEGVELQVQRILDFKAAKEVGRGMKYAAAYEQRKSYRAQEMVANGISTGTKLDNYIRQGGLWPKSLALIIAGYGGGKSTCLVSFARAAITESCKKVLYVTIDEADEFSIADRFDAVFSGVPLNDLKEEEASVEAAMDEMRELHGDYLVIKEFSPGTLTVPMLRGYLRRLERESFYPDLICVDYADLMVPSVVRGNEYEDQGSIYVELRGLAIDEKLCILTAAQVNREGLTKEIITGANVAESAKKLHRADFIVSLNKNKDDRKNRARFWVDKNRGGDRHFEVPVHIDFATQLVKDL